MKRIESTQNALVKHWKKLATQRKEREKTGEYIVEGFHLVEEALEKLKDDERELLFLRYTNEETINDIAKYYQVSRFVINRRIKKVLNNLKEVYEHG